MMGMKVTVQGPGRQIADKTYYMGELRKKCDEMQSEIRKMNVEVEQYNKDNQIYNQMERKYEVLIKDVRKLQGDLADLNLIVDKSRNNTDPQDIASAFQALKGKNDADRRRLDRLFLDCQEKENDIRTIEQQCAELQRKVEEKLNALPQDQRMQHAQLQDDYKRLLADVEQKQLTYDNLCRQLSAGEEVLLAEPLKQRLNSIQEQKLKLLQEKQNLEAELSKPVMSEDEEREMLLSQVKEDNNQIKITERNMEEIQSKTRQVSQDLEQLEKDGGIKESEDAKKYQRLREKDQEMTEFIENFDQNHSKESSTVKEIETRIFKLLEHISKDLQRQQQLPSKENFQDLQDEVAVKQRGLENSQSTAERLKQEKKNRDAELEKIVNLDQKINVELTSLREKSEQMKQELEVFNDINKLKKDAESNRLAMTAKKAQLDSRRKALKQQVQLLSTEFDKAKQDLATNDFAGSLEAAEQKLRHYEQNIFHLREFIDSKEAETDYGSVYEEVEKSPLPRPPRPLSLPRSPCPLSPPRPPCHRPRPPQSSPSSLPTDV
uniref:Intraflagellar transport protein 74 homolog n=1 Tax=Hanusia phi TaxID=3032 RepID=A0A7S0HH41_9CRYP